VALILSSLLAMGLVFALLFIDARDKRLEEQRQRDFGELRRIERLLREGTGTLGAMARAVEPQDAAEDKPLGPLLISFQPPAKRTAVCESSPNGAVMRICSRGQKRQVWVEVNAANGAVGEANLSGLFEYSLDSRVREVAIVGPGGEVLLQLRGDGPLPSNLRSALATRESESKENAKAVRSDAQARPQTIEISGAQYQYYEVPLDLDAVSVIGDAVSSKCLPRQCSVAALVAVPGLVEDFRSLSPMTRAIFTAILVLFLLSTPIIKLVTIDRNASLHWLDVASIGLSVPLIVATLSLLLMVMGHWTAMRDVADHTSQDLARTLSASIGDEIDTTRKQMAAPQTLGHQPLPLEAVRLFDTRGDSVALPTGSGAAGPSPARPAEGFVTLRVNVSRRASPANRPYFQRLLRNETLFAPPASARKDGPSSEVPGLWTWPAADVVDQVRSVADGSSKLVVAFRAAPQRRGADRPQEAPADAAILVGIKQLASTISRPLPEGFGFAVLDPDSLDVLQHSDRSRAHVDSFAEQFRRNSAFRSARDRMRRQCTAAAGAGGGSDAEGARPLDPEIPDAGSFTALRGIRYSGLKTNMTLAPVCSAGWMVVVWYETAALQLVPVEAGVLEAAMVLLAALSLHGLAILIALPAGKKHFRWLWPSPALEYRGPLVKMVALSCAWALFSLVGLVPLRGDELLLHALGCILIFTLLALVVLPDAPGAGAKGAGDQSSLRRAWRNRPGAEKLLLVAGIVTLLEAPSLLSSLAKAIGTMLFPTSSAAEYAAGSYLDGVSWRYVGLLAVALVVPALAPTNLANRWTERLGAGFRRAARRSAPTQRRQAALIVTMQAAALVVFGAVPAMAAYSAAWDAKRLFQRDADIERFEAAQAAAVQEMSLVLAKFTPPAFKLCYRGKAGAPWKPWNRYFRGFETDVDPTRRSVARNALRRWFREPPRSVKAVPQALDSLGLPPCEYPAREKGR
jgi:hypothetical protein